MTQWNWCAEHASKCTSLIHCCIILQSETSHLQWSIILCLTRMHNSHKRSYHVCQIMCPTYIAFSCVNFVFQQIFADGKMPLNMLLTSEVIKIGPKKLLCLKNLWIHRWFFCNFLQCVSLDCCTCDYQIFVFIISQSLLSHSSVSICAEK